VANRGHDLDVLNGMIELVDGSLVRQGYAAAAEGRFEMLETVREFALEQLTQGDEHVWIRDAHAAWLIDLVERAGPELIGPHRAGWMSRLEQEVGNLRAALAWAWSRGDVERVIRLAAPIWNFWFGHGYTDEALDWLVRALGAGDTRPSVIRAEGFYAAGSLAATQVDHKQAVKWLEEALSIWRALDDQAGIGRALQMLGTLALEADDSERAVALLEQVVSAYESSPAMRDSPWVGLAISQLAGAVSRLGNHEDAVALGQQGLARQRTLGSPLGEALALVYLGDIELDNHNFAGAYRWYVDALDIMQRLGDDWYMVHILKGFTIVLTELGRPEAAARVLGAQEAHLIATGHKVSARYEDAHTAGGAKLRAVLGEEAFAEARTEGAALGLDAVVMSALEHATD
jgi:tetratricopeptide (TPR) repeat protein